MSAALRDHEANILSSVNSMEECAVPLAFNAFSGVSANALCVCVCVWIAM